MDVYCLQKSDSDKEVAATTNASEIKFTLKQLIRKLHIVEPVENVMCLIGKRFVVMLEVNLLPVIK